MKSRVSLLGTVSLLLALLPGTAHAIDSPPNLQLHIQQGRPRLDFTPYPAVDAYVIETTPDLNAGFLPDLSGLFDGYTWTGGTIADNPLRTYRLRIDPVSPNALLTSIALNRLAYGPTPDELERILTGPTPIGPDAYIAEQLAPEKIAEDIDAPVPTLDWQYVTITGIASSSTLYIYTSSAGEVYLDDLKLVAGTKPEVGANLLANGDFESTLPPAWTVSDNLTSSTTTTDRKHGGNASLHLVATAGGTTRASAIWQTVSPSLKTGQTYTLSYWYLPSKTGDNLTLRLSGSGDYPGRGIDTTHSLVPSQYLPGLVFERLSSGNAALKDLRAWHALHAVRSRRQALEVLLQFVDNHFTSQYTKSRDYIDGLVTNDAMPAVVATDFEFRELLRWRQVLLDPNGTFYDLLRVSAESPAMIIYLDTVTSAGGNANENFSRELMELFTMGVDNGYDQTDIEQMSRAWTGWRVDKLPPGQENNPYSAAVTNRTLAAGTWTLRYRTDRHDNAAKTIFKSRTVDARFGPPYAGRSYQLNLPARSGTAGMQDGYDVLHHLADLPYTQEYIAVKLCRLLINERFHHGVDDYTDPNLSPEGRLIRDCMAAWETPGPDGRKGNLRRILGVITASDLFRHNDAAAQKVKSPLESVVSTVRALRAARPTGGFTADTDGYDMLTTLGRLNFNLFNRTDPDGWSEYGRDWISTAALVERMRFAQNFLIAPRNALKEVDFGVTGTDNIADPVALLKLKLPEPVWRNAQAVTDFFLGLLFTGEGRGNLDLDRRAAIAFLNANDTGTPDSSPFAALDPAALTYDGRVRGMVAFLLGLPQFQEQ